MMSRQFAFDVFADYHQFYVQDGGIFPEAPTDWTDEDVQRRAKTIDHVVVICPVRNMTVPVVLELHDSEPAINLSDYDHVVQCSLELPSGELQVHECTGGEVLRQTVAPGRYAVLALFLGLDTIDAMGLEGNDTYRILLWPTSSTLPLAVLKAWTE
ncbi:MAG: hypothetical protein V4508_19050 [Pseudomonadota bacterium]